MKVLFMNMAWDAAGCSILQARAVNRHTDWEARHFRAVRTFDYDTDITPENYDRDEFAALLESVDVIEWCSADHRYGSLHKFNLDLWEFARKKINIFHDYNSFIGQWEERAKAKDVWHRCRDLDYAAIFSSIPQARYIYHGCIYVPDIVDERAPEYTPDPDRDFSKVILGHYPTGGGNNKNTVELRAAIQKEPVEHDIPAKTIFYSELLRRKRKINLGFDALWRGFHGMTTVENLALGIPTMCRIDKHFWPAFNECFLAEYPGPILENVISADDIIIKLQYYNNDTDQLRERSILVRNFMLNHWSYEKMAKRTVKIYEGL